MAAGTRDLEAFVRDALPKASRQQIEAALLDAGWPRQQVATALDAYADQDFPVPVPKPRVSLSSQEAFAYLVLFSALYFGAWHLCSLLFDFINLAFPDAADLGGRMRAVDSLRWSASALFIAFPLFLFMSWRVARDVATNPARRLSPVRRWLTHLTLFIAAMVLVGDMTTLVYNVLGGELTSRFVLKVASLALVAGGAFAWYLWDLRREEVRP